jgi:hypothetical protein
MAFRQAFAGEYGFDTAAFCTPGDFTPKTAVFQVTRSAAGVAYGKLKVKTLHGDRKRWKFKAKFAHIQAAVKERFYDKGDLDFVTVTFSDGLFDRSTPAELRDFFITEFDIADDAACDDGDFRATEVVFVIDRNKAGARFATLMDSIKYDINGGGRPTQWCGALSKRGPFEEVTACTAYRATTLGWDYSRSWEIPPFPTEKTDDCVELLATTSALQKILIGAELIRKAREPPGGYDYTTGPRNCDSHEYRGGDDLP